MILSLEDIDVAFATRLIGRFTLDDIQVAGAPRKCVRYWDPDEDSHVTGDVVPVRLVTLQKRDRQKPQGSRSDRQYPLITITPLSLKESDELPRSSADFITQLIGDDEVLKTRSWIWYDIEYQVSIFNEDWGFARDFQLLIDNGPFPLINGGRCLVLDRDIESPRIRRDVTITDRNDNFDHPDGVVQSDRTFRVQVPISVTPPVLSKRIESLVVLIDNADIDKSGFDPSATTIDEVTGGAGPEIRVLQP